MSFAVPRTKEPDDYPVERTEPRLVLIHGSDEPEPVQPVHQRAGRAAH
jgi:hypothetical protein